MKKQNPATKALFKVIVYAALIVMTISIIIPVAWVFMPASSGMLSLSEREPIPGRCLNSFSGRTM